MKSLKEDITRTLKPYRDVKQYRHLSLYQIAAEALGPENRYLKAFMFNHINNEIYWNLYAKVEEFINGRSR